MFLDEDCKSASDVMMEIADPFAAIVLWTPDETGRSDGKKCEEKLTCTTCGKDTWKVLYIQNWKSP